MNRLLIVILTVRRYCIALEFTKAFVWFSASCPTEAHVADLANLVLVLT